jgi:hypothetical protein
VPSTTAATSRTWLIAATCLMATLGVVAAVSGLAAPAGSDTGTRIGPGASTGAPGGDPQTGLAVDKWPRRSPLH